MKGLGEQNKLKYEVVGEKGEVDKRNFKKISDLTKDHHTSVGLCGTDNGW